MSTIRSHARRRCSVRIWLPMLLAAGAGWPGPWAHGQEKKSSPYIDEQYGFSVVPPAGWEDADLLPIETPGEVRAVWSPDGSSTLIALVQKWPGANLTARQLLASSVDAMEALGETRVLEKETRSIAGREAMWMLLVAPGFGGALEPCGKVRTAQIRAAVPRVDDVVVLQLTTPESSLPRYRPAFEESLKRLKVDDAAPSRTAGSGAVAPTPGQVKWLRKNAIAFKTVEAGNGFEDLKGLREMIGEARIVALGEATHGTREFFLMKHRLVEFLASEMGFTVFSIEASMPEAFRVDDYVSRGEGDPAKLLAGMYFWTWNTEEVLEMIEWMHGFNRAGPKHMRFTGFDMQTPSVAMEIVQKFLDGADPEYAKKVQAVYAEAKRAKRLGDRAPFGTATGSFPVEKAAGRKIRFSGFIKTEKVDDGYAGLWWRADGKSGVLAFDNMVGRGASGTTDWSRYEIVLDMPQETVNINFGLLLDGGGTAWYDDLEISVDGQRTDLEGTLDLGFESGDLRGFKPLSRPYSGEVVNDVAKDGSRSLRIRREEAGKPDSFADAREAAETARKCQEVVEYLESHRGDHAGKISEEKADWAIQNARLVHQWRQLHDCTVSRDESMARNVQWILDHSPPKTKIVLWAHNGHINRTLETMGGYLDRWYGKEMVVVGFTAHAGRYTAFGRDGVTSDNSLKPSEPGSLEYALHKAGLPRLILDLRKTFEKPGRSSWLTRSMPLRYIGADVTEDQFFRANVRRAFDVIIYFDETTATKCFVRDRTRKSKPEAK